MKTLCMSRPKVVINVEELFNTMRHMHGTLPVYDVHTGRVHKISDDMSLFRPISCLTAKNARWYRPEHRIVWYSKKSKQFISIENYDPKVHERLISESFEIPEAVLETMKKIKAAIVSTTCRRSAKKQMIADTGENILLNAALRDMTDTVTRFEFHGMNKLSVNTQAIDVTAAFRFQQLQELFAI